MREFERFPTSGANALQPDYNFSPRTQIIDINEYRTAHATDKRNEPGALAFRPEFYENASDQQIKDDILSYLGEYRFEVSEHKYSMGILDGKLVDPNSKEPMTSKAQKAIDDRKKLRLNIVRETAELEGLISLENQFMQKPNGTAVWLSPPGLKEDGYADYGFAFTGIREGNEVKMTAIRLETPSISDFNHGARNIWGEEKEQQEEDFLREPRVLDMPQYRAKGFIHNLFEVKSGENDAIFQKAIARMDKLIDDCTVVIRFGTQDEKVKAIAVLENVAIEIREELSAPQKGEYIYIPEHKPLDLEEALLIGRYIAPPPPVAGSCGMSGKIESSNFLGKLLGSSGDNLFNKSNQEWFSCPKCTYKADGPIGNICPGCGLTKEQYVEEGGEKCD